MNRETPRAAWHHPDDPLKDKNPVATTTTEVLTPTTMVTASPDSDGQATGPTPVRLPDKVRQHRPLLSLATWRRGEPEAIARALAGPPGRRSRLWKISVPTCPYCSALHHHHDGRVQDILANKLRKRCPETGWPYRLLVRRQRQAVRRLPVRREAA
jgi:hypothetical protein